MSKKIGKQIPLNMYAQLDDNDIFISIKQWQNHDDFILSYLSKSIINRNLLKIELTEISVEKSVGIFSKKGIKTYFNYFLGNWFSFIIWFLPNSGFKNQLVYYWLNPGTNLIWTIL